MTKSFEVSRRWTSQEQLQFSLGFPKQFTPVIFAIQFTTPASWQNRDIIPITLRCICFRLICLQVKWFQPSLIRLLFIIIHSLTYTYRHITEMHFKLHCSRLPRFYLSSLEISSQVTSLSCVRDAGTAVASNNINRSFSIPSSSPFCSKRLRRGRRQFLFIIFAPSRSCGFTVFEIINSILMYITKLQFRV